MSGSDVAGMIVCTPEPGMLNWIRFVVFGGGGFALEALMACRKVHVTPHTVPSVSAVEVTVKVMNGVAVGVGVGVGVTSGDWVSADWRPPLLAGALSHRV